MQVSITDSMFSQCSATEDGGALVARTVKSSVSIGNSSFVGNAIAAAAASGDGGAVSLDGVGTVSLSITTMKRNFGKNGGALCITTSKSVELDSCSMSENKATLVRSYRWTHLVHNRP